MRSVVRLIIAALYMAGCAGPGAESQPLASAADAAATLAKVSANSGIDYQEAKGLTDVYFATFLSGCGFADGPTLRQGIWRSRARVGYAGELLPGAIEVNAETGGIGYAGCPVFRNVEELRAAVERAWREPQQGPPCWARNRTAG